VAVEVPDTVNDLTFLCADFEGFQISFNTDVVVAGEYVQGDPFAHCLKDAGQFEKFLSGDGRDAVLDIPEQDEPVWVHTVNNCEQPLQPGFAPAPEMEPVHCKVGLDAEVEIGNNKIPLFSRNDQRRAVANKFQVHNGFTNPFWGW
jgi:hypothetical protein